MLASRLALRLWPCTMLLGLFAGTAIAADAPLAPPPGRFAAPPRTITHVKGDV
jgi:hypothetical protein